jgi:hypothetical protein
MVTGMVLGVVMVEVALVIGIERRSSQWMTGLVPSVRCTLVEVR